MARKLKLPTFLQNLNIRKIGRAVGIFLVFRFLFNIIGSSVMLEVRSYQGHGWDHSKVDLEKNLRAEFLEFNQNIKLPQEIIEKLLQCNVEKRIEWLNKSACSYEYNKLFTSKEEHLKEQEECLAVKLYNDEIEKIFSGCFLSNVPNSWPTFQYVLEERINKDWKSANVQNQNKKDDLYLMSPVPLCVAHKSMLFLVNYECRPLNLNANNAQDLFGPLNNCLQTEEYMKAYEKAWKSCLAPKAKS